MPAIRASSSPATRATGLRRTCARCAAARRRRSIAAPSAQCGAPPAEAATMAPGFVHLRLHSEYSLLDSVVRVPELIAAVAAAGMPAVAVTDQSNLFALVKFYREALEGGVKPIVGVDLVVGEEGERREPSRLTLLCQTQQGYRNLARLLTRAYLD